MYDLNVLFYLKKTKKNKSFKSGAETKNEGK